MYFVLLTLERLLPPLKKVFKLPGTAGYFDLPFGRQSGGQGCGYSSVEASQHLVQRRGGPWGPSGCPYSLCLSCLRGPFVQKPPVMEMMHVRNFYKGR